MPVPATMNSEKRTIQIIMLVSAVVLLRFITSNPTSIGGIIALLNAAINLFNRSNSNSTSTELTVNATSKTFSPEISPSVAPFHVNPVGAATGGKLVSAVSPPRHRAPRIVTVRINPEKIRDLIGKGGATVRGITEETNTLIDINDDGLVRISSPDAAACQAALDKIKQVTAEVEVGKIYEGTVVKLTDFGAFVTILPGRDGLVHISQIADERIEHVSDRLKEGQKIRVKVLEIDRQGRIRLTMRDLEETPA